MPRHISAEKTLAAEAAFVPAAWRALPVRARRALFAIRPEGVDEWARLWRVDARCMIRRAREYQELASADPDEGRGESFSDGICNIDETVNARPPDEWMRD